MKTTITKSELIELRACKTGLSRFLDQIGDTEEPVEIVSLIGGLNTVADLLWLAVKLGKLDKVKKFARDCALLNIEKVKSYCSESDYSFILKFLNEGDLDSAWKVEIIATRVAEQAVIEQAGQAVIAAEQAASAARVFSWAAIVVRAAEQAAEGTNEDQINERLKQVFLN